MSAAHLTPLEPELEVFTDGDVWIVASDIGIHGAGESPLDALRDYDLALAQHRAVLERDEANLSVELAEQLARIRAADRTRVVYSRGGDVT